MENEIMWGFKKKYDQRGFDKKGKHINGTIYDDNGYDKNEFNTKGSNLNGVNKEGKASSVSSIKTNKNNKTLLDMQAGIIGMNYIEKAEWKLKMAIKTQADEVALKQVLSARDYCKNILKMYDLNGRCINNNSKTLLIFAGIIDTYFYNEGLRATLTLFNQRAITWGEFVEFMHKFIEVTRG